MVLGIVVITDIEVLVDVSIYYLLVMDKKVIKISTLEVDVDHHYVFEAKLEVKKPL